MKIYTNTYQSENIPTIAVIERENSQAQIIILNDHYYVRMPNKILSPVNQHIVEKWIENKFAKRIDNVGKTSS